MMLYTVIVTMPNDPDFEPWAITFSSREKATEYMLKLDEHMERIGINDDMSITIDSGELDDGQYYLNEVDSWFD